MNKKKIISTTIMFIAIVATISVFKNIFGDDNSFVAVAGVTAALCLLESDYTINPIKNTIYFVCLEVVIGIASFLANLNPWLGLVITFFIIFYLIYLFTYDNENPKYVGFTLGYFFMLYSPVTASRLPFRLAALATFGLLIMLLQLLSNRNRVKKQAYGQLKSALKYIREEILLLESSSHFESIATINKNANSTLKNLIETLYYYIDKGANLPISLYQKLFMAHFLDSININLNHIATSHNTEYKSNFNKLLSLIDFIDEFIDNNESIDKLFLELDNILNSKELIKSKNYLDLELHTSVAVLKNDLQNIKDEGISKIYSKYFVTDLMEKLRSFKNNISKDSARFTFAFRCALLTSIGVFFVNEFNISSGKWIIFSLHAITQPYSDYSKAKGRERILGTIVGLIIFEILFTTFKDTSTRSIIILVVGYLSNYKRNYFEQVIYMTISALGAASIGTNLSTIGAERLIYVLLGTIVALIANKIILPFRITDSTKDNLTKSIDLNKRLINMLYSKCSGSEISTTEFNTLVSVNKFVNNKIEYNNHTILSNDINDYVYNQHIFMNDIRILSNIFINSEKRNYDKLKFITKINFLNNEHVEKDDILKYIVSMDNVLNQVVLINMIKLRENIRKSKSIAKVVNSNI